ncbi:hypothetical protein POTOM_025060 [Populus tomentosa]|uniref:Uncharacterized protein n=1 Tax=Populus tomentosa TaxID=118781 RepID=A0A8X7ZII8_POPTO|nr:hypothetical protein POTOM_025060 [Populus tomentosa]
MDLRLAQVIVIGVKNRPNSLDLALRRFGRVDKEVDIGVPDEAGRLEVLRVHAKQMKLSEDRLRKSSQRNSVIYWENMDIVDLEYDTIDAKIRNSMDVSNEHFNIALGNSNPSSLHETNVEAVPNVRWILEALRRPGWSFKRLFNIQWSIPRSLACHLLKGFFSMVLVVVAKHCWLRLMPMNVKLIPSAKKVLSF